MDKCDEFKMGLLNIANKLEEYRCEIYQEEVSSYEDNKQSVDDILFSLQSQIRNVSGIVEFMSFEAD